MFISDLFEDSSSRRIVVTYPGRFQPFHLGHAEVFRSLQSKFGADNVFIVTSNKVDGEKSPFNFSDKVRFMHAAGIPDHSIIEASQVYKLPDQFEGQKENLIFVVAVGEPDKQRLNPGTITKKTGGPSYFQNLPEDLDQAEMSDRHGYVVVAGERHKTISIGDQQYDVSHGTAVRKLWNHVRKSPEQRQAFLKQLYGRSDPDLGNILDKIPQSVAEEGGVGVVKAGDKRYSNALTVDVKPDTLGKEMKAYGLIGRKSPSTQQQKIGKNVGKGVYEGNLKEFAPPGGDSGDDGFSDETLKRLAAQWYQGDEDPRVERTLAAAGWEIGQDEGYDDEPGVFVIQAGDVNGNSYMSWPAHELQGMNESWKSALGGAALAGAMALGGSAHAQSGEDFLPDIVAHVTFKINGNTVTKDINLGTSFKSPGEASAALEEFLKSRGIKFYEFSLERVKKQGMNEGFNSKQEVIDHFVKQGKSAAAGAMAWERGWRGSTPKKKPLRPPVRSYHDDLDDKRYDVKEAEIIKRMLEIKEELDTLKPKLAKYKISEMSSGGTGAGGISTAPSAGGGSLFGGSYERKDNPFAAPVKKKKANKK